MSYIPYESVFLNLPVSSFYEYRHEMPEISLCFLEHFIKKTWLLVVTVSNHPGILLIFLFVNRLGNDWLTD